MSRNKQYDPEDLEKLLSTKSFSQLLAEEKAFVLQYVDNAMEYESMRETFSLMKRLPQIEPSLTPKAKTKETLLTAFDKEKKTTVTSEAKEKKGFWAWFWNPGKSMLRKPVIQLACMVVLFITAFTLFDRHSRTEIAEHKIDISSSRTHSQKPNKKSQNEVKSKKSDQTFSEQTLNNNSISKLNDKELIKDFPIEKTDNSSKNNLDTSLESENKKSIELNNIEDISSENLNSNELTNDAPIKADALQTKKEPNSTLLVEDTSQSSYHTNQDSLLSTPTEVQVIADNYHMQKGNSAVAEYSIEKITNALDSSSDFADSDDNSTETSEVAISASEFSTLLFKLYTSN